MRAKLLITVLTVTFAAASSLQAQRPRRSPPTRPATSRPATSRPSAPADPPAGPVLSAYERLEQWDLAEMLTTMHMTEALRAMAAQYEGDPSVNGLSGYASAMIGMANSETDPAVRRKLLDKAAASLPILIEKTKGAKTEEDIIKYLGYRLKLMDLLGRSQCRMHADALLMLMGGEEDRRIILFYTDMILTAKKVGGNTTRTPLEELQDLIDAEVEKVHADSNLDVNYGPPLNTLQNELKYSSAWFKLYRGLASTVVAERADLLESAIELADKYAKGDYDGAQGPDPASLLLQGQASTEKGITLRMKAQAAGKGIDADTAKADADKEFANADGYFKSALDCKSPPDDDGHQTVLISADLKVIVLYQIVRNLIEWGKFDLALKAVDEYGPTITRKELLGKDAQVRADVNTTILKNHLYLRWAENTTDKAQADNYRQQSQKVLLDFIAAHRDRKDIIAAFYKIIANKYRDAPTPPPGVPNDEKYIDDYLSKLNPAFQLAIAQDEVAIAIDLCDLKNPEDRSSIEKVKAALKLDANAEAKKHMEKADKLYLMIINDKSEDAAPLQADASRYDGEVEEMLDQGWEAAKKLVGCGKKDGVLDGCVIFRRILNQPSGAKTPVMRKEFLDALARLVGNAEWVKDPKVSIWFVDLGEQYAAAAEGEKNAPDKQIADYEEGIKAYRQVPDANPQMYMEAQHKGLSMEYDLIETMANNGGDGGKVNSRSLDLSKRLGEYIARVKDTIKQVTDAAGGKPSDADKRYLFALKYWGADSAYLTALVMYEYLNLKKEAMDALDKMPDQWPDADDVLRRATVYEVRKHIAAGETDKAIEHIEEMRKIHPDAANALMQEVIGQLRNSIHEIEHVRGKEAELKKQRDAYLLFATELLKTHPNDYSFEQMLADALLENGQLDEALKKFEKLAKIEQDNRAAKEKEADDFVDKLVSAMDKAQGNIPEVKRLAKDFPKAVSEKRIDPSKKGYAGALATVLAYAEKTTTDPEDAQDRAGQVVKAYKAAMNGLRKDLKNVIPRDSVNMGGLARLYKARKEYTKALENYNPLVAGLWVTANDKGLSDQSRRSYLAQYGQALLERTQCKYEYFLTTADAQKKKEQMQNLLLEIKTFRDKDPQLWGQYADFNIIEADAQKIAGTK